MTKMFAFDLNLNFWGNIIYIECINMPKTNMLYYILVYVVQADFD